MFEVKDGKEYQLYNNLNQDKFTYKQYDTSLKLNSHGMFEIKLQTNDTTLLGASSSINKTKEVISTYQITFNNTKLNADALLQCKA